ncbi:hypothetical protein IQ264_24290 [Phormidium sp. LEGE 05292]|uniref:hypothetical protein n=1 Tax=[Phormidium] sp. LEGE 05292 TaxID=767427 RepID=UPI00187E0E4B|nr:hypothetical protein [Phormidium sp. LEGE 05292]MBE9228540.1 hypothetical protein [Phormidium sp. LEGE 05292]
MNQPKSAENEVKLIILCENCSQKLRIPKRKKKLRVTCPNCRHEFNYKRYLFGFSSNNKKSLLVGLVGSLIGFFLVEIVNFNRALASSTNPLVATMITIGAFGICFGTVLGGAEGFFRKNKTRLYYGLKTGAILGLISGIISGFFAQLIYNFILSTFTIPSDPSLTVVMFARTVGWCILGLLLGAAYGIKENTLGDLKFGLIGGAIGGFIGGLFFDPLSIAIQLGGGTVGRLVAFSILGMTISVSINYFREVAIRRNKPEMYQEITRKLPPNPRLLLPDSSTKHNRHY